MRTPGTEPRSAGWSAVARRCAPAALVLAVAVASYRASFAVPFQFDDIPNIVENPAVHAVRLDGPALARAAGRTRPLAYLSFALNYRIGRLEVGGYHAVNLAFHAGSGLVVLALAAELLALAAPTLDPARRRRASLVAALVFVAHPLNTQAVTYVVQRMASMGAFLGFSATLLYFRARTRPRGRALAFAGAAASALLAALSKENFVALPAVLLASDALLLGGWRERLRRHVAAVAAAGGLGAGAAAALWVLYRDVIASESARYGFTIGERLLTQARVVWHYASLLAWPAPGRLQVDYDFPPSHALLDPPSTAAAVVALAAVAVLAWRARQRAPLLAFAVVWFLGNLAVESSILPIDLVFEHRVYFPSFGPILAASAALELAVGSAAGWRPWAVAAPLVALLAVATDVRNRAWRDPAALQAQAVAGGNETTRALMTIGALKERAGDLDGAQAAFRRVLEKNPREGRAAENLAVVARRRGDDDGAERWYREALAIAPGALAPRYGLAELAVRRGQTAVAEAELSALVRLAPRHADAWVMWGALASRAGDHATALGRFSRAVDADPGHVVARRNRALELAATGRSDEALGELRRVLELDVADPEALRLLADLLVPAGRGAEVEAAYREALRRAPTRRGLHFDLGTLLGSQGRLPEAERELLAELALAPHAGAYNNLGNVYLERDPPRAREMYRRALELDPSNASAAANLRAAGGR